MDTGFLLTTNLWRMVGRCLGMTGDELKTCNGAERLKIEDVVLKEKEVHFYI